MNQPTVPANEHTGQPFAVDPADPADQSGGQPEATLPLEATLPTMADLDRMSMALDDIDATLDNLDRRG